MGPSFLGKIPNFTDTIFPKDHKEPLELTASLGLILFLFIVGLELDPSLLGMNAKRSLCISFGGQSLTWLIACLLAYVMYENIDGLEKEFPLFLLFIGVASSVTAFPVLSRILTEGRLLNSKVGSATIGSAAFDDITAWSMLALVIALTSAGEPQQAAYIFLVMAAFVIFMLSVGRIVAEWVVDRAGIHDHVSRAVVCYSLLLVLICGWFTQIIGVDAIFGAFVVGLMVPRQGNLTVELMEKIEDVVSVLLLPLYFAVSGLKTDFNALDTGKSWGFVVLVIFGACVGKIVGCGLTARLSGLSVRESLVVGCLMNTRGLVELIILNAGLDAEVINDKVFAIMVLMAVATTCMTSPLTAYLYPPHLRTSEDQYEKLGQDASEKKSLWEISSNLNKFASFDLFSQAMLQQIKLMVCLPGHGVKALSSSMAAVQLFRREGSSLHAVRVLELSDRFSADLAATHVQRTLTGDSVLAAFSSFCGGGVKLSAHVVLASIENLALDVLALAKRVNINTIMIGWEEPPQSRWAHHYDETKPENLIDGLFYHSATSGTSVAVAVDRGALSSNTTFSIAVPILSFSHCECEALLMALAMSVQTKASVTAIVVGINSKGPSNRSGRVQSAVTSIGKKEDSNQESNQLSVRSWLHGHKKEGLGNLSSLRQSIYTEANETQEKIGREILSYAAKLGINVVQLDCDLNPKTQIETLINHLKNVQKVVDVAAAEGGIGSNNTQYPLILCGRHATGSSVPDHKSVLGYLGGEIYDTYPTTSLIVIHSAMGQETRNEAEAAALASIKVESNFFERSIHRSIHRRASIDSNKRHSIISQGIKEFAAEEDN